MLSLLYMTLNAILYLRYFCVSKKSKKVTLELLLCSSALLLLFFFIHVFRSNAYNTTAEVAFSLMSYHLAYYFYITPF